MGQAPHQQVSPHSAPPDRWNPGQQLTPQPRNHPNQRTPGSSSHLSAGTTRTSGPRAIAPRAGPPGRTEFLNAAHTSAAEAPGRTESPDAAHTSARIRVAASFPGRRGAGQGSKLVSSPQGREAPLTRTTPTSTLPQRRPRNHSPDAIGATTVAGSNECRWSSVRAGGRAVARWGGLSGLSRGRVVLRS